MMGTDGLSTLVLAGSARSGSRLAEGGTTSDGRTAADLAIRTDDLGRRFGQIRAVDGLSLKVPRGIVFGFLGPNGSGKTTTIRLLLGLLEPTAGRAEVLGFDTSTQGDEIRARTGALLEHSGLYERLNAEENLEFYARVWRLSPLARRKRVEDLLSNLGLWDRRREPVGTWSRGMKQKLAIARTLLHQPTLIFLDEPTAGLDPVAAAALHEDLSALVAREGVTVFLTTHNLAEAETLCQQVAVINRGRLIACGPPDSLLAKSGRTRVEVFGRGFGEATLVLLRGRTEVAAAELHDGHLVIDLLGEAKTGAIVSLIVSTGAEVEEVRKASLEDVFLELVEVSA